MGSTGPRGRLTAGHLVDAVIDDELDEIGRMIRQRDLTTRVLEDGAVARDDYAAML